MEREALEMSTTPIRVPFALLLYLDLPIWFWIDTGCF